VRNLTLLGHGGLMWRACGHLDDPEPRFTTTAPEFFHEAARQHLFLETAPPLSAVQGSLPSMTFRNISRLLLLVAAASLLVACAATTVPTVVLGIYRHGSTTVAAPLAPLSSKTDEGSTIYAANGTTVLATLRGSRTELPVKLTAIAPILIHAVLDTEDERFYEHGGIDLPSTLRAFFSDSAGHSLQGGSTIAQQLVKQEYLNSQRTLSRKLREAVIANRLEKLYTKNQILDTYLNIIYLGSGAYGVQAAAETYWGETAAQLTLPQAALLAGLIQAPSGYDPINYPAAARVRRSQVLGRMLHYHTITRSEYNTANAAPLPTSVATPTTAPTQLTGIDGYYVAQVENQLLNDPHSPLGATFAERKHALFDGGLKIYTNLDPTAQAQAEAAVTANTPANTQGIEESLVAINPANGNVTAMIAGQNYATSPLDVVTQGREQPGSGFKIFTLLAALEAGDSILDPVDGTSPCAIPFPGNDGYLTAPAHNDEGDGQSGVTTILNATAQSLNCAYLRMGHQIGLPAVVAQAEKLGIPASEIGSYSHTPSMVIGTAPVAPIQMAAAYATLASGGIYHAPQFLNRVVDQTGTTIYREDTTGTAVIPPRIVAEADAAFQAVVQDGTGVSAQIPGRQVAGKTGTNSGPTSVWFNGYTPQLETTVWMGNPRGGIPSMVINGSQVYGASYAAPTVRAFLAANLSGKPAENLPAVDYASLPPPQPVPEASAGPAPTVSPATSTTSNP
jgi:membrane peptidoglycan carboxypeptidase